MTRVLTRYFYIFVLVLGAGCGRPGLFASVPGSTPGDDDDDDNGAQPYIDVDYVPPPADDTFGDGKDGDLTLNGSQTVNNCYELLDVSANGVLVSDWDDAEPVGRMILLHQAQEPMSQNPGDQDPITDPADINGAGTWELVRVMKANPADGNGNRPLETDPPPTYAFGKNDPANDGRSAQACTVPEYENLTIPDDATLSAGDFTIDYISGIAFVLVRDTLTIEGDVDADEAGFWGFDAEGSDTSSDVTDMNTNIGEGGRKGEGLDAASGFLAGRGNYVNGGGGGNAYEAGGGGGGNGGAGGIGGRQADFQGNEPNTRGLPGVAIALDPAQRLVFGGGGGSGQQNDNDGGRGGDGGGIIVLRALRLRGSGDIHANGEDGGEGGDSNGNGDGAGGGGAGGTIYIETRDSQFDGAIEALGGDGGDVRTDSNFVYGPGGGGGGGTIALDGVDPALADASAGTRGVNADNGNAGHGSADGQDGQIIDVKQ